MTLTSKAHRTGQTPTISRATVRLIGILAAVAAEVLTGVPAFAAPAPKIAAPAPRAVPVRAARPASHASMISRNPHLHGFTSERPTATQHSAGHEPARPHVTEHEEVHPHVVEHEEGHARAIEREEIRHFAREELHRHVLHYQRWWDHHWIYTGDYRTWYVSHTGLGQITGTVATNGAPVSGAVVVLRKPGGRIFRIRANKHLTHTNALGHFTMLAVHPGNYRIVTQFSRGEKHAQVHVAAGVTSRMHFDF